MKELILKILRLAIMVSSITPATLFVWPSPARKDRKPRVLPHNLHIKMIIPNQNRSYHQTTMPARRDRKPRVLPHNLHIKMIILNQNRSYHQTTMHQRLVYQMKVMWLRHVWHPRCTTTSISLRETADGVVEWGRRRIGSSERSIGKVIALRTYCC
jgi:hypothetical protein